MTQMIEHMLSMYKALCSICGTPGISSIAGYNPVGP